MRVVLGAAWPRTLTLTFAPILLAQPLLRGDMSHEAVDAQAAEFDRARGSSLFGLGVPREAAIVPHDDSAGACISWSFSQAIPRDLGRIQGNKADSPEQEDRADDNADGLGLGCVGVVIAIAIAIRHRWSVGVDPRPDGWK